MAEKSRYLKVLASEFSKLELPLTTMEKTWMGEHLGGERDLVEFGLAKFEISIRHSRESRVEAGDLDCRDVFDSHQK